MTTRLMPSAKIGNLPKQTDFRKDDVLYKIVGDKVLHFLVTDDTGERRLILRAYEETGRLSNRSLKIQGDELGFYKIDHLATNLRRAYFISVGKHEAKKAC